MLASTFLDTAIGIIFVFLLLSVIATTVNEIILSLVNMRGRMLLEGFKTLLNDPEASGLVSKLYNHGEIYGLFQGEFNPTKSWKFPWNRSHKTAAVGAAAPPGAGAGAAAAAAGTGRGSKRNLPSYIPTRNFVVALLGILTDQAPPALRTALDSAKTAAAAAVADAKAANDRANVVLTDPASTQAARDAARQAAVAAQLAADSASISANLAFFALLKQVADDWAVTNDKVGKPLLSIIANAENDITKLKTSIENWYNGAMDRVSGWYKYHTQWVLFWIGVVLAVTLNANTLTIIKQISINDAVRQALVAAAAKAQPPANPSPSTIPDSAGQGATTSTDGAQSAPGTPPGSSTGSDLGLTTSTTTTASTTSNTPQPSDQGQPAQPPPNPLQKVADQVSSVNNLGLPLGWGNTARVPLNAWLVPFYYLLGWLITAIAVSLGAPFWFDLLNKFMVVRSTVKPQEKSQEEGSKDKQP